MISYERLEEIASGNAWRVGELTDMAQELLAHRKARDGWQFVPVEPTEEMIAAALKFPAQTRKQYAAMLAAAPKPFTD
ncbi:MAG: hypothetical protein E6868_08200 [Pantoea sp.]|uniref:hypothetical protein n=1 Tax=Pantoea sp. TaxID=69393 RepID=UPI0028FFC1AC|nr:hypothetical protein [Pantoea sp.]MDU1573217.1 hypothetical protein [Pantoea sp.]